MIEYVLIVSLLVLIAVGIGVTVWDTKVKSKDSSLRTVAIYSLYEEIKRLNDEKEPIANNSEELYKKVMEGKKGMEIRHGNDGSI